ncbi:hypothetical protein GGF43_002645 [Coemansia sp. RSA 2618]|nr:hypothetical protein GGF43_002645 [Coemansia sp. RSA 2618]
MGASDQQAISGIVQLWSYDCAVVSAPTELLGVPIQPNGEHAASGKTAAATWFQGHLFASQDSGKQYSVLGVPAQAPPPIHGCMISEHDKPVYYDVYISEYLSDSAQVKICALNVERSGGSGDAIELLLDDTVNGTTSNAVGASAKLAKSFKLSTTKLLTGNRAQQHLAKYAPDTLNMSSGCDRDAVVCLGVASIQ